MTFERMEAGRWVQEAKLLVYYFGMRGQVHAVFNIATGPSYFSITNTLFSSLQDTVHHLLLICTRRRPKGITAHCAWHALEGPIHINCQ